MFRCIPSPTGCSEPTMGAMEPVPPIGDKKVEGLKGELLLGRGVADADCQPLAQALWSAAIVDCAVCIDVSNDSLRITSFCSVSSKLACGGEREGCPWCRFVFLCTAASNLWGTMLGAEARPIQAVLEATLFPSTRAYNKSGSSACPRYIDVPGGRVCFGSSEAIRIVKKSSVPSSRESSRNAQTSCAQQAGVTCRVAKCFCGTAAAHRQRDLLHWTKRLAWWVLERVSSVEDLRAVLLL